MYELFVGSIDREDFWRDAPIKVVRNKIYGFESVLDLRKWSDRETFFLRRWSDLPAQLLTLAIAAKGGTIVDVGANRGQFTLAAASIVGSKGRVICFEPNTEMAAILKSEIVRNGISNITVHEAGLSDKTGKLALCVPAINSGGASFGGFAREGYAIQDVAVLVGDEVLQSDTPHFVKIDVEGFELRVIDGLSRTIERAKPVILMEVVEEHLARCGTSPEELFNRMSQLATEATD